MDVFDVTILATMAVLAVFFAFVAIVEWRDGRAVRERMNQRADAHVIQHPQSDRRVNPAA